jgi:hypothetical protein
MLALFSIVGAIEIFLIILEGISPRSARFLPLGQSHLAQLGVLFGGAAAVLHIWQGIPNIIEAVLHGFTG